MSAEPRAALSVHLTSSDMASSLRFYRDQCSFELKESWPSEEDPQWANLVLHGQSVMIGSVPPEEGLEEMCGGDPDAVRYWRGELEALRNNRCGVGVALYVQVPDIDAYASGLRERGVAFEGGPKTQFYGIRELRVNDPSGYVLVFHTPVAMSECQSCGMPLADAAPGQMYCSYCIDEDGKLRPYEQILEGTVTGYFMGMQKMSRADAERAAREHLARMPAWAGR
jgi:uncharacterized glyoxalase superfamily protein PhnB